MENMPGPVLQAYQEILLNVMKLHQTPDDPVIPEGIPIPGPRPGRSNHPPVTEPDSVPPPPAKEPPAPARKDQLAGERGLATR